jgi:hypothetical protein
MVADGIIVSSMNNDDGGGGWTGQLFSTWYFESAWVKAAHNIFHSPITLAPMIVISYYCSKNTTAAAAAASTTTTTTTSTWCFWMLAACFLHTLCDIPVHHDDGPLILFPINWEYRFRSPLSYWDPDYHGRAFAICEHVIDIMILVWECRRRCCDGGGGGGCCMGADGRRHQASYQRVVADTIVSATTTLDDDEDRMDLELATLVVEQNE